MQPSEEQSTETSGQFLQKDGIAPGASEQVILDRKAVEEGLVYPPPPSFYENMPEPSAQPPLPSPLSSQSPQISRLPPSQQQPFIPGTPPPFRYAQPPRKSRRWLWILLASVGVFLLLVCGLCGWGIYSFATPIYQQVSGSLSLVNDFYGNLQKADYVSAYQDVAQSGLTQAAFTQQAQARDAQYGRIKTYQPGQPSFRTDSATQQPDLSQMFYPVDISRTSLTYTVILTISKIGQDWKIIHLDTI